MSAAAALRPVRRALLSVSDKTGIADFARALSQRNVEILSTGGTARLIAQAGIAVIDVADYTGFPALMGGRVKTLHPKVHGGLLGRRGTDEGVMAEHGIEPIDLLVVNLYPFERTIASPDCTLAQAIDNIDIGGPAMLRAAAKNHDGVGVVTDATDYPAVLAALDEQGGLPVALRFRLAVKAFAHTAGYDRAIANYLARHDEPDTLPDRLDLNLVKAQDLRYGENPHQKAAFYRDPGFAGYAVATAEQLQGKPLSYNNIADADAALECVRGFDAPACVIVKHANPCGVAVGVSLAQAYEGAFRTDPTSAFGGIIAFNAALDAATARDVIERQFVEVIIAPAIEREALAVLRERKSLRVLACGYWTDALDDGLDLKRVRGGLLVQQADAVLLPPDGELKVVTRCQPSAEALRDLRFVWRVARAVKSNAIVYGRDGATLGIGAGQMSRVDSARIGARKAADAGLSLEGSALASDAFFPFRDGVEQAAAAGVAAIIQPGGSIRDDEIVAAADEHGIAMVFTHMRHFRH